ncbi:protein ripply2-like [Acipenser oxyrinchus oxyrinchus]|uniref:Protein ripply2-like n=1 Tax=Acipenser oxyrinchus oxyrinchus TaxID=40147 RepID=A0AAD8LLP4_ACIOX|nr:protein ripply2-like [Acipenser oxyrinchus oxyrinchus]
MQNNHTKTTVGLTNNGSDIASVQQSADRSNGLWRPWAVEKESHRNRRRSHSSPYVKPKASVELSAVKHTKTVEYTHPVKLFWPRSKCYDYLYQEAETLLRNYPVQATISFYEDSDSDDESDSEEEEELN